MKIGFVQPDEEIDDGQEVGFIETALGRGDAEMSRARWALMIFLHFCIVQVIITFATELFQFFSCASPNQADLYSLLPTDKLIMRHSR